MGTLTAQGYIRATKEELRERIFQAWRSKPALGDTFLDSDDAPQTAIADSIAELVAVVDEAVAAVLGATSRTNAVGQQLDNLGDIIGVPRRLETFSTVTATVNLQPGTTLPAGSQAASAVDDASIYETLSDVTNATEAAASFTVEMRAIETGSRFSVSAGDLTSIVTPVTGWNSVTNAMDSVPGTDKELDPDYKIRQALQLSASGTGTMAAIEAAVGNVVGVSELTSYENVTGAPDANGLPGKSFQIVVIGGADDAIAQAIWNNKPAGILSFGVDSGTAIDAKGQSQEVNFSRPIEVPIYIDVTLVTSSEYQGDASMKALLVSSADSFYTIGKEVVWAKLYQFLFQIPGVLDVTLLEIGGSPSPSGTANISIQSFQVATFDTSRVTVIP
jgi:uncharacterized phage protein gp47/JayE